MDGLPLSGVSQIKLVSHKPEVSKELGLAHAAEGYLPHLQDYHAVVSAEVTAVNTPVGSLAD